MDAHNGHAHHEHRRSGGGRLLAVIALNVAITLAEYVGGALSGSLALISDAGHNLSDVLSLVLGYTGERISQRKASRRFSFGLKRFEVLIALVNSLSLILIGLYLVFEAVQRYLHPVPVNPAVMLPVAVIGLLGNFFSILVLGREKNGSLNLRAAFLHLLYDAVSSAAVIAVGVALIFSDLVILDLAASIVIAFMIVWSSMNIIRESMGIFLQGAPRGIDPDAVYNEILGTEGVQSVHGLHIWSISSSEVFLSCHICVGELTAGTDTDSVIGRVNAVLEDRFGIRHTAVQVEINALCSLEGGDCCK